MVRATDDRKGCGTRERERLVYHRDASRPPQESMESSGESADGAFMLNMHLAAALVGSESVPEQRPLHEERSGQHSNEHVLASYTPRFHRAVRNSEPFFPKLVDVSRPHLLFSLHGLYPVLRMLLASRNFASSAVGPTRGFPAACPLTERKRRKRADGGGKHWSLMRLTQTGRCSRPRAASMDALGGCTATERFLECRVSAAAAGRDRLAVYLFSQSIAIESSDCTSSRASQNPPGSQACLLRHKDLVKWRSPDKPRIYLANTNA